MTLYVADHSFSFVPSARLKAAGYSGDIGYCSHDRTKNWTQAQIKDRIAAALQVGVVWETVNQRAALSGAPGGAIDGPVYLSQAQGLGATGGVLYVCLEDPNVLPRSQWPGVVAYAQAIAVPLHAAGFEVGGYGSDALLTHVEQAGHITRKWSVETWPRGSWNPALIQLANEHPLNTFGGAVDCNIAAADWGQTLFFGAAPPIVIDIVIPDPYPDTSQEEGPMATATYPKDTSRLDGLELGGDGVLRHWARSDTGDDLIHPEEWPIAGLPNGASIGKVCWLKWKADSSGMWACIADGAGHPYISLMQFSGEFSPWTPRDSVSPLKV